MNGDVFTRSVAIASFLVVMLVAGVVVAAPRKCPVCGQVFPQEKNTCPNDGTDLNLLGQPVEVEPESVSASGTKTTTDDSAAVAGGGVVSSDANPKYIRQDQGGKRKRTGSVEDDEVGVERSDRRRRIGIDRRGADAAAEKRRQEQEEARARKLAFDKKDEERRMNYQGARQDRLDATRRRAQEDDAAAKGFEELRWRALWAQGAPFTSMGARLSWMREGSHSGPVAGAEMDVNFVKTNARVGLSTFLGVRRLPDRGSLVFLESLQVGFQRPWRYSPWLVGRAGIGALLENRFDSDITHLLRAIGVEAGIDCRITPAIVVTPSLGYVRYAIDNASWNSLSMKLSIGF